MNPGSCQLAVHNITGWAGLLYSQCCGLISGTYQGQWLRGVRHGYGLRQSVSYDVAIRYPTHTAVNAVSIPVPGSTPLEKEDDLLLRERDFRIEESRGGFVLRARTSAGEQDTTSSKHRMILDKHGKPSLRKTIAKVCFKASLLFYHVHDLHFTRAFLLKAYYRLNDL